MADPREPIREALYYGRNLAEWRGVADKAIFTDALAALRGLCVVQPGEVLLSAEEAEQIVRALSSGERLVPGTMSEAEANALALLASGPDREAEA